MRECEALCFVICVCMRVFWGFRGKCIERIMGKGKEFVFCGCSFVLRIRKDDWWGHTQNNGNWSEQI